MSFRDTLEAICAVNDIRKPIFVYLPGFVLPMVDALSGIGGPIFYLRQHLLWLASAWRNPANLI